MENEKKTEQYLRERVRELGGRAYKFESPGNAGVPDRLVVLPGGKLFFAEIKSPTGRLTPLQMRQITFMQSKGQPVYVIRSCRDVDEILERAAGVNSSKGGSDYDFQTP